MGYDARLLMGVYRVGAGRFVLTLATGGQLGQDPVAERLLRNLRGYAAAQSAKAPADLPAGLERQLQSFGY